MKFGPALPSRYKLTVNHGSSWETVEVWEGSWNQAEKRYDRTEAPRKALYDENTGAMLAFEDSRSWN